MMVSQNAKEEMILSLRRLIDEIPSLGGKSLLSSEHMFWKIQTIECLEFVFGRNSRYYRIFVSLAWRHTESLYFFGDPDKARRDADKIAYKKCLDASDGLLRAAMKRIESSGDLDSLYEGKDTAPESSEIVRIQTLAENDLRKIVRQPPKDEKEVQVAFENLLIGAHIAYTREGESIEYSSKFYIPDFTFPKIDLALDVKLCNRSDREKSIIGEINDDILAYKSKYGNLLFIVYDSGGFIRDIDRFKSSFEDHTNVIVRVVKH
jgi:hypothetical protein